MINYDSLKTRAEDAIVCKEFGHFNSFVSVSPRDILQMLRIIETAKGALHTAYKFDASNAACLALDLIAKIEGD